MHLSREEAVRVVACGDSLPDPLSRIVFAFAHPDDEVIGAASRLPRLARSLGLICVTDGSPGKESEARRLEFPDRAHYRAERRREMDRALALAGILPEQVLHQNTPDQEASRQLVSLTRRMVSRLQSLGPVLVVTHPYEGGHPDHDATAFAVHTACLMLEQTGTPPPPLVEMTSYHIRRGEICPFEFLPDPLCPVTTITLSEGERRLKRRMMECHASQRKTLAWFPVEVERFRPAPRYDFTAPPHPGKLFYEHFDWGVTGARWRGLAAAALEELEAPGLLMAMTVLSVAYPLAPVGPDAVGGAEQILSALDRMLVEQGHRSLVVACEGSAPAGRLISVSGHRGEVTDQVYGTAQAQCREAIERALDTEAVDVVHMHGMDFHHYLPRPGVPVLTTLHLPPSWYPPEAFGVKRPQTWLHCVSRSQQKTCPPGTRLLPVIENGVEQTPCRRRITKRGFALALGRICPEKGFHFALEAAALARSPLLLAGQVFPYGAHEHYYRAEILPRLDRCRRFLGPVGGARKRRLLQAARCLLIPSLAPETSSLVAMEALAQGTPVIAFPSGALPEIVEHGRTGYLVHDAAEMADAIRCADRIDPEACLKAARARFTRDRMTGQYFAVYRCLAAAGKETVSC